MRAHIIDFDHFITSVDVFPNAKSHIYLSRILKTNLNIPLME